MSLVEEIYLELQRARARHAPMHSAHEGYAVILEEFDELWDEVKLKQASKEKMRREALQIAAMAVRFIEDVCEKQEVPR